MSAPAAAAPVVAVSSGDSATSKTRALAAAALELAGGGRLIALVELPADALLGRRSDPEVDDAVAAASSTPVLVLATPIYRATFNGAMKAFLDRLVEGAIILKVKGKSYRAPHIGDTDTKKD